MAKKGNENSLPHESIPEPLLQMRINLLLQLNQKLQK